MAMLLHKNYFNKTYKVSGYVNDEYVSTLLYDIILFCIYINWYELNILKIEVVQAVLKIEGID